MGARNWAVRKSRVFGGREEGNPKRKPIKREGKIKGKLSVTKAERTKVSQLGEVRGCLAQKRPGRLVSGTLEGTDQGVRPFEKQYELRDQSPAVEGTAHDVCSKESPRQGRFAHRKGLDSQMTMEKRALKSIPMKGLLAVSETQRKEKKEMLWDGGKRRCFAQIGLEWERIGGRRAQKQGPGKGRA